MYIDEKEIAKKKVQDIRNKANIDKQLRAEGISSLILENPRYQSILSRISYMMMNEWARKDFVVNIDKDGNVVLSQSSNGINVMGMKYYIDKRDKALKRVKVEFDILGEERLKTISTYDSDGIETCLLLEQKIDDDRYLTKITRVDGRPDFIKIERIDEVGQRKKRLPNAYQSRVFFAAMEDIEPDPIDVDPFNICFFELHGFPSRYMDVSDIETKLIEMGVDMQLSEEDRAEQVKLYKKANATFNRTTVFEEAVAEMFGIYGRMIDDD